MQTDETLEDPFLSVCAKAHGFTRHLPALESAEQSACAVFPARFLEFRGSAGDKNPQAPDFLL